MLGALFIIDVLIYRGRSIDVDTVLVGGKVVLRNRRLTTIDKQEVIRKLQESIPPHYSIDFKRNYEKMAELKQKITEYFSHWYEDMERIETAPYYLMNNRY